MTDTPDSRYVEVRWRGRDASGAPATGRIELRPAVSRFLDADAPEGPTLILGTTVSATINQEGYAVVSVPPTEDFTYTVTEILETGTQSYSIEVPHSALETGIDLAECARVPVAQGAPVSLVKRADLDALAARTANLEKPPLAFGKNGRANAKDFPPGTPAFDRYLGIPIWSNGVTWVNYRGVAV